MGTFSNFVKDVLAIPYEEWEKKGDVSEARHETFTNKYTVDEIKGYLYDVIDQAINGFEAMYVPFLSLVDHMLTTYQKDRCFHKHDLEALCNYLVRYHAGYDRICRFKGFLASLHLHDKTTFQHLTTGISAVDKTFSRLLRGHRDYAIGVFTLRFQDLQDVLVRHDEFTRMVNSAKYLSTQGVPAEEVSAGRAFHLCWVSGRAVNAKDKRAPLDAKSREKMWKKDHLEFLKDSADFIGATRTTKHIFDLWSGPNKAAIEARRRHCNWIMSMVSQPIGTERFLTRSDYVHTADIFVFFTESPKLSTLGGDRARCLRYLHKMAEESEKNITSYIRIAQIVCDNTYSRGGKLKKKDEIVSGFTTRMCVNYRSMNRHFKEFEAYLRQCQFHDIADLAKQLHANVFDIITPIMDRYALKVYECMVDLDGLADAALDVTKPDTDQEQRTFDRKYERERREKNKCSNNKHWRSLYSLEEGQGISCTPESVSKALEDIKLKAAALKRDRSQKAECSAKTRQANTSNHISERDTSRTATVVREVRKGGVRTKPKGLKCIVM